jgi:hypothetical protein
LSYSLEHQRIFFGVTCDTSADIISALKIARGEGQDMFFSTLKNAIDNTDEDIICGHVDWFRVKFSEPTMNAEIRSEVMAFYKSFIFENPIATDERPSKFISQAYDKFI